MIRKFCLALAIMLPLSCAKKEPEPAATSTAEPAAPAAPAVPATVAEPPIDLDSVPVEEDFEAEAEKEVTATTVAAKVDEIEKEIGGQ